MKTPIILVLLAGSVFAESPEEFLRNAEVRDRANRQEMETNSLRFRMQSLEDQRVIEMRQRMAARADQESREQARVAEQARWDQQVNKSLNASWDKMKRDLTRQYPDLKKNASPLFMAYQTILQNLRESRSPALFNPMAPKLIADQAAQQVGVSPLP